MRIQNFVLLMADNVAQREEILENIKRSIIAGNRCFETDDLECNTVLVNLRQAHRSLQVLDLPQDTMLDIEATVGALIDQTEMKLQLDRRLARNKAFAADRQKHSNNSLLQFLYERSKKNSVV